MRKTLFLLAALFVIFSFSPSIYEINRKDAIPKERYFVLEHNYLFDYNFYLSRIKEGLSGRWTVVEKYYNQPHQGSLFQIFYLMLGEAGRVFNLTPPVIYHGARLIFGFLFLAAVGYYISTLFSGFSQIVTFLLVVNSGSWPVLVKAGNFWRFATYMGWWSVVDSLQRITFLPHVLFGQLFILLFIFWLSEKVAGKKRFAKMVALGLIGFVAGIIFPPTVIVLYGIFGVLSLLEIIDVWTFTFDKKGQRILFDWFFEKGLTRLIFLVLSSLSLLYVTVMFNVLPWSALSLFDIQHRTGLSYNEYFMALGPVLPLGILGGIAVVLRRDKKLFPAVSWVAAVFILFKIFENVPTQSPLRFTEAAIHVPLGILTGYLAYLIWKAAGKLYKPLRKVVRAGEGIVLFLMILMGIGVMLSMVMWLTDQVKAKAAGTWPVPIGAELVYPLKDFMNAIFYIRDNTNQNSVVLGYVTAGNYIPAYAGNFVYIGHANTPDEDGKEKIAARFFSGKMTPEEAKTFLTRERISYILFGPQEKELGGIQDLSTIYSNLSLFYKNSQVVIYKVGNQIEKQS
ncbi:hypothetical protein M1271_06990 [Patescibacteria group bacterium]|nr:hypothetical protein [Patescibacteria group bacterium]